MTTTVLAWLVMVVFTLAGAAFMRRLSEQPVDMSRSHRADGETPDSAGR